MTRRVGNQVREAFQGDGIAILDKLLDRFFKRENFSQRYFAPKRIV